MKILHRILPFLLMAALPMRAAVNRAISIYAPAEAAAGNTVSVAFHASTDAGDGEQIGFLHAEYSIDEGKTWTSFCSAVNSGVELSREGSFAVNAKGERAIIRVRVAFRGGVAGDVDYKGGAIQWSDSWQKWRWPPAKYAVIHVANPVLATLPIQAAVKRAVSILAPVEAPAGSTVSVTVQASTDASDGEQIGFLHADYSTDEGKTWTQFCYAEKSGAELSRKVSFTVNAKGGKAIVRVRVAFRGGVAGDVDYKGGAIQWNDSWQKWRSPPTKYAIIYSPKP
jgi:Neuraminidase (sialidase)